jgi:hypothetical protein
MPTTPSSGALQDLSSDVCIVSVVDITIEQSLKFSMVTTTSTTTKSGPIFKKVKRDNYIPSLKALSTHTLVSDRAT